MSVIDASSVGNVLLQILWYIVVKYKYNLCYGLK